ncbi:MAG: hypothetical protein E7476_11175 [Ruminococcaceae bacterium]|nr:hypothetical protein [Oscillospiraceae bacterium]
MDIFEGIFKDAMTAGIIQLITSLGGTPIVTALIGLPAIYLSASKPFFQKIIPGVAAFARTMGISKISIAAAAFPGYMLHGVTPTEVNQFIILALFGVKYAKLVKDYVPWALGVACWMIVVSTLTGVLPI